MLRFFEKRIIFNIIYFYSTRFCPSLTNRHVLRLYCKQMASSILLINLSLIEMKRILVKRIVQNLYKHTLNVMFFVVVVSYF